MNINMTGFIWFSKIVASLDESSLSIGKVKHVCSAYVKLLLSTAGEIHEWGF